MTEQIGREHSLPVERLKIQVLLLRPKKEEHCYTQCTGKAENIFCSTIAPFEDAEDLWKQAQLLQSSSLRSQAQWKSFIFKDPHMISQQLVISQDCTLKDRPTLSRRPLRPDYELDADTGISLLLATQIYVCSIWMTSVLAFRLRRMLPPHISEYPNLHQVTLWLLYFTFCSPLHCLACLTMGHKYSIVPLSAKYMEVDLSNR